MCFPSSSFSLLSFIVKSFARLRWLTKEEARRARDEWKRKEGRRAKQNWSFEWRTPKTRVTRSSREVNSVKFIFVFFLSLPLQIPSTSDASGSGIFGFELSFSFSPEQHKAPLVVMMLTEEIERQARNQTKLDLYSLYRTKIPLECLTELRDVLNTSDDQLQHIDLAKYEIQYLVSILKRYLRELPDPVIPVKWYEQFINIFKQNNEKQTVVQLMHLIGHELPEHHRVTFQWIMAHLCRICCMQFERGIRDQPLPLVQVFCHIFLRPVWGNIVQIVYNTRKL